MQLFPWADHTATHFQDERDNFQSLAHRLLSSVTAVNAFADRKTSYLPSVLPCGLIQSTLTTNSKHSFVCSVITRKINPYLSAVIPFKSLCQSPSEALVTANRKQEASRQTRFFSRGKSWLLVAWSGRDWVSSAASEKKASQNQTDLHAASKPLCDFGIFSLN